MDYVLRMKITAENTKHGNLYNCDDSQKHNQLWSKEYTVHVKLNPLITNIKMFIPPTVLTYFRCYMCGEFV